MFLKWTEKGQSHRDKKGPQLISSFFKTHFGTKFSKIESDYRSFISIFESNPKWIFLSTFFCVTQLLKPLFFCIKASEIPKKIFLKWNWYIFLYIVPSSKNRKRKWVWPNDNNALESCIWGSILFFRRWSRSFFKRKTAQFSWNWFHEKKAIYVVVCR